MGGELTSDPTADPAYQQKPHKGQYEERAL